MFRQLDKLDCTLSSHETNTIKGLDEIRQLRQTFYLDCLKEKSKYTPKK